MLNSDFGSPSIATRLPVNMSATGAAPVRGKRLGRGARPSRRVQDAFGCIRGRTTSIAPALNLTSLRPGGYFHNRTMRGSRSVQLLTLQQHAPHQQPNCSAVVIRANEVGSVAKILSVTSKLKVWHPGTHLPTRSSCELSTYRHRNAACTTTTLG